MLEDEQEMGGNAATLAHKITAGLIKRIKAFCFYVLDFILANEARKTFQFKCKRRKKKKDILDNKNKPTKI